MNKRLVIIGISTFIFLVIGLFVFSSYQKKALENRLTEKTKNFISAWGTYEDESSDKYLDSIKPFMTDKLYSEYQNDALSLRELKKEYEGTVDSKIEIHKVALKDSSDKTHTFQAGATRTSEILEEETKEIIEVTFTKEMKDWKVSKVTATDK